MRQLLSKVEIWLQKNLAEARLRGLKREQKKTIVIWDLDNTLAKTWPSLVDFKGCHFKRLRNLEPFSFAVAALDKSLRSDSLCNLVCSARALKFYRVTDTWLKMHLKRPVPFVLVPSAAYKASWIKRLKENLAHKDVILIDDLSFNHEHGEVKFYEEESEIIQGSGIRLITGQELQKVQDGGVLDLGVQF